jgi:hypothetical protein
MLHEEITKDIIGAANERNRETADSADDADEERNPAKGI